MNKFQVIEIAQDQDVSSNLKILLKFGFWTYHEYSIITQYRKQIQGDPKVVRELAKKLKELKKLFKKNCIKGKFNFDSALHLFEIDGTEFKEERMDKTKTMNASKKAVQEEQ